MGKSGRRAGWRGEDGSEVDIVDLFLLRRKRAAGD
jgi:hypothetical protein